MSTELDSSTSKFSDKYRFWLILVIALVVMQVPVISIPFKWFESFFHEISHGLAAIFTGGSIVRIELFTNGAGLCTTRGGSAFLISFSGYAGASAWGMILYWFSSMHQRLAQVVSLVIVLLLATTLILWVRDFLTFTIIAILLVIILLKFKLTNLKYLQFMLQIIAAVVLLNSVRSPLYLIDGRELGDGAALANMTMIPEMIWVVLWCILGLLAIVSVMKLKMKTIR
ncbi:M50 family metallopeptidase [Thalassotalea sp. G2M2-11]|uniref:M50 family metallopeptidase n=1 Tax=Thalassotalea sp. G2M2-11 TaxID=2787627 RepID=UPI0019CF68C7|nr:M50 family metallopeptidase [Thalassotalea sp. G2M2-11]